jgi:hypothetical protein
MATNKRLAGTCYIKVDGEQLEVSGGVEAPLNENKREPVSSATGVAGYKETTIVPYLKVTAILVPGFPKAKLNTADNMTITAEMANGDVYTLSGAWLANEASHKADDGTTELEFNGTKGNWQ